MPQTILICDDDPTQRRLLQAVIEREGYAVLLAEGGQEAIDLLEGPRGGDVSLVILDLIMPNIGGMDVLARVRPMRPDLPIIVLTAQGGIETVVSAMQAGAADFFVKPASPERIHVSIKNALSLTNLKDEVSRLKRKQKGRMDFGDLIGSSPAMAQVARLGERAARSSIPILIDGESGVGKEMVARAIQGSSDRAGKAFVTVNCGAIPENLVESILFGHEKGSFTGASERHIGKFQEANGGTLFLDEVGELPLDMQVKLLRAIQENEVDPIGAKRPVKIDVRIISATNRDLLTEVREGRFREDLYYRLNVFPVQIPPLRERRDDIALLIEHFINRYNAEEGKQVRGVAPAALDVLRAQPWPGNVRQLENAIFRAVVLCDGDLLTADDFPHLAAEFEAAGIELGVGRPSPAEIVPAAPAATATHAPTPAAEPAPQTDDAASTAGIQVLDRDGHLRTLEAIERDLIELAIATYDGQMSEVARRLGIGRSTLYRKVREQGIDVRRAS
ncbi:MAG: sigma-54 dependent transcriptional regulator [Pseudomonadota bacterium]